MTTEELKKIYDEAKKAFEADTETQNKIKNSSDKELIDWLFNAMCYGEPEIMPIANAVHKEAMSRGGNVADKCDWIWGNI